MGALLWWQHCPDPASARGFALVSSAVGTPVTVILGLLLDTKAALFPGNCSLCTAVFSKLWANVWISGSGLVFHAVTASHVWHREVKLLWIARHHFDQLCEKGLWVCSGLKSPFFLFFFLNVIYLCDCS